MSASIRKKAFVALFVSFAVLITIKIFVFSQTADEEDKAHQEYFCENYKVFGLTLPTEIDLAGEKVPLYKFSVREGLDRELTINTYWQSHGLMMHKLANRWFPVIEPILKKNNVPDDLKYVVLIESGLTNVISPAGATGYWQLLENTAKSYGLEVNSEVDERYHIEKSTEAACRYFKDAYKKFNRWTLAIASYNMGISGIQKQMKKQQATNYYDLFLNDETSRYVFRVLAMKEIISHPQNYGYVLRKKDLYPSIPTQKIRVDSSISDLANFAIKLGANYKILKYFNPWLRKNYLTNKNKKEYFLTLPLQGFGVYGIDEFVEKTDSTSLSELIPPKADSLAESIIYVVKQGEDVASIAKLYGVDENLLRSWNELGEKAELKTDQELLIYIPKKN